jgi:peptidoglycan/LPS O-acetylase OafA/YrhL
MLHTFVPGATYSINVVLWTIALEAHFYLLYPLLLVLRRRFGMAAICAALFALMLASRALDSVLPPAFAHVLTTNFVGRWWEWVLGAVIAERLARAPFRALPRRPVLAATVALALAFCWVQGRPHGVALLDVAAPFANALVVWWSARLALRTDRRLDLVLAGVGVRSYSLYLTHPITLTVVAALAAGRLTAPAAQVLVALVASYAVAQLYFVVVERRFLPRGSSASAVSAAPAVVSAGG